MQQRHLGEKNMKEKKYLERREKVDESKGIPHLHLYINILYIVLQISQQKCAKKYYSFASSFGLIFFCPKIINKRINVGTISKNAPKTIKKVFIINHLALLLLKE